MQGSVVESFWVKFQGNGVYLLMCGDRKNVTLTHGDIGRRDHMSAILLKCKHPTNALLRWCWLFSGCAVHRKLYRSAARESAKRVVNLRPRIDRGAPTGAMLLLESKLITEKQYDWRFSPQLIYSRHAIGCSGDFGRRGEGWGSGAPVMACLEHTCCQPPESKSTACRACMRRWGTR